MLKRACLQLSRACHTTQPPCITSVTSAVHRRTFCADAFEDDLFEHLRQPNVFLLDVRTASEVAQGSIEGSVTVPYDELDTRLHLLPEDLTAPIVVYCAIGRRSEVAKKFLGVVGYSHVFNGIGYNVVKEAKSAVDQAGPEPTS